MRIPFRFPTAGLGLAALLLAVLAPRAGAQQSVQFSSLRYSVRESAPVATITVARLGGSAGEVTVNFETRYTAVSDATPDSDYLPTNGTLSFGPGITSRMFVVPILKDTIHELNEQVIIELSNPVGAIIGNGNTTLTILDDDTCVYALVPTSRTHGPEAGGGEFAVRVINGCDWTVTKAVDVNWLQVFANSSGSGTQTVFYSLDPNPLTAQRSVTLKVAGKSFVVTQRGVPPPDLTKPVVTITTPASGARVTNLPFVVTGRATDAGGVARVEFRVENRAGTNEFWTLADGTTNWTASVDGLLPGLNTVRVRAVDASENTSAGTPRAVNFVVVSPIHIEVNSDDGSDRGIVTGAQYGQFLDVGKTYTITAAPLHGKTNLFAGWSGDIETNAPRLTFVMRSNLSVAALFVANPFLPVHGQYNGFVGSAEFETSGFLTLTMTDLGAYTAKLTLGGKVIPLSGRFDLDGRATHFIQRPGLNPLTIQMVSWQGTLTGQVTDGNFFSALEAERGARTGATNGLPEPGRYRLLFGTGGDGAQAPNGTSYATATLDAAGRVTVVATLADGTVFSQRTLVSPVSGRFAMFGRLYGGAGHVASWVGLPPDYFITFGDGGQGFWLKSPPARTRFYTNGFAAAIYTGVTRYVASAVPSTPFIRFPAEVDYTGGHVVFSGGNLAQPFTNVVRVDPVNRIIGLGTLDQGTNRLSMSYSLPAGTFAGTVTVPGVARTISFKGSLTSGFFLGTNECGSVRLQAAP